MSSDETNKDASDTDSKQWPWSRYIKGYEIAPYQYLGACALECDINDENKLFKAVFPKKERLYLLVNDESLIPRIKERFEILRELDYGDWPPHIEDSDGDY